MEKLERVYTVPLGKAYETVRQKRAIRAVSLLRAFLSRHMKEKDGKKIKLSEALNGNIWASSIQRPPRRVKIRAIKADGVVKAYLAEEKIEEIKKEAKKPEEKKPEATKKAPAKEEKKSEEKTASGHGHKHDGKPHVDHHEARETHTHGGAEHKERK